MLLLLGYATYKIVLDISSLPLFEKLGIWKWINAFIQLGVTVLFFMGLAEAIQGRWADQEGIHLSYPLKSGFVGHGGNSVIINYHNADSTTQKYALDISALNNLGLRAMGLFPEDLNKYEVYGDTLIAPASGKIIDLKDGLDNMKPGEMDKENITGNYLVLETEGNMVFMCHLLKNSLMVDSGQIVKAGQPLAQIGNSGHTSEPHLHIHAIRGNDPSQILNGEGLPIYFNDRFLCRNDRF